jgi:hypothetical protein
MIIGVIGHRSSTNRSAGNVVNRFRVRAVLKPE